ncbi:DoxX family protein [Sphingomonas sp. NFR15]|uniref:DoxX family protein n=1 Tax=Sphingomonas sp. NFR15 TaxID=1566282 RepID=UPI00088EE0CE|nr:DoxX family protein [Sphingomonas sp. NFR15]SDA35850.1 DoxX-like family protein [Sphingomonas sp. NFR15]
MAGNARTGPGKGAPIADWIVRILLGTAFVAAGGAKLAGAPPMVAIFDHIGIGQWFRLLTGALEISGAVLVLVPRTAARGASLLSAIMVGAVFTHLVVIGGNPAPALVLLALSVVVLSLRRRQLLRLAGA